jgi:magnesium transporter
LRDEISTLLKNEPDLILDDSMKYFRDVLDHTYHIMESVENFKEINSGLRDMYLSNISLKMNQVMQILTIFSTIFIPLTFIVGVYGMNFDVLPELHWKYGYFAVWGVMVAITTALLLFFRRRGWLFRKMD